MIILDANVLLYAGVASTPEHARAHAWLTAQLREGVRVGVPWVSSLAFLRLSTNPRVFARPATVAAAWKQVTAWLDAPGVFVPEAGEAHRAIVQRLLPSVTSSRLVPDAHLAALAIEHGCALGTTDGDFARFAELRVVNPLHDAATE